MAEPLPLGRCGSKGRTETKLLSLHPVTRQLQKLDHSPSTTLQRIPDSIPPVLALKEAVCIQTETQARPHTCFQVGFLRMFHVTAWAREIWVNTGIKLPVPLPELGCTWQVRHQVCCSKRAFKESNIWKEKVVLVYFHPGLFSDSPSQIHCLSQASPRQPLAHILHNQANLVFLTYIKYCAGVGGSRGDQHSEPYISDNVSE